MMVVGSNGLFWFNPDDRPQCLRQSTEKLGNRRQSQEPAREGQDVASKP